MTFSSLVFSFLCFRIRRKIYEPRDANIIIDVSIIFSGYDMVVSILAARKGKKKSKCDHTNAIIADAIIAMADSVFLFL